MASLLSRLRSTSDTQESRYSMQQWMHDLTQFTFGGVGYTAGLNLTMEGNTARSVGAGLESYARNLYGANGPAFALIGVRMRVFSAIRFTYQRMRAGRPQDLFGDRTLQLLEKPWPGGTTQDLLARMLLHADLAGQSYAVVDNQQVKLLRPDWVDVAFTETRLGREVVGYIYWPDGDRHGDGVALEPAEVAHFAPYPDPLHPWRGMSWLTPVLRELQADGQATDHLSAFFENAAPQPLDAKILTPSGWSTMGDMKVGSQVIGSDGRAHRVTGVYPQGQRDIYRVHFSDGGAVECTDDHVWTVSNYYDRQRDTTRRMTLSEIVEDGVSYPSGPYKWAVPMPDPVRFNSPGELPVDPYLLGLLLGDGCFRGSGQGSGGVSLCCHIGDADETQHRVTPLLPEGVSITRRDRGGWAEFYFRGRGGPKLNPLTDAIRSLGLADVLGRDKFIPSAYLKASVKDRVDLLQGLVDSDGNVHDHGVRYSTTSQGLADGLTQLVGSLGGVATVSDNRGRSTMAVHIRQLPTWITPARLARKVDAHVHPDVTRVRTIVDVERVGTAQAQCIRVDTDDHLYVTDDFVLTHNTPNLAVTLSENLSAEQFEGFVDKFREGHKGVENAYKTLMLGGGADVTVVGADLEQLNLKDVQGGLETRLSAAAGVPATVVGFREGLQGSSLNTGNYAQSRRQFADGTLHPMWANVAGSVASIIDVPADARLWYDARDVPFLREDAKDAAEIQQINAQTIARLTDSGFDAGSVVDAVMSEDLSVLDHSGLFSVQLQPPNPDGNPQRFTDPAEAKRALAAGWTFVGDVCSQPDENTSETFAYRPHVLDQPRIGSR